MACKAEIIRTGFTATGLIPFDPNLENRYLMSKELLSSSTVLMENEEISRIPFQFLKRRLVEPISSYMVSKFVNMALLSVILAVFS
ncbi:hypothetical protein EYZ11_009869 [Aspergillus tanneri]|uniref:Uncharacterized protein n=1 Tax=Aspergillus tanneri TaxID=1220188 RepID=A0A4S3J6T3_9EURO|nr:hypothetical protein EYZ11_009869 [Aspergillus tanneri]